MIDTEALQNKILYLMKSSDKCSKKAMQNKIFVKLFNDSETSAFIAREFIGWYKKYNEKPSLNRIYQKHKDTEWGSKLSIAFKVVHAVGTDKNPPQEHEFESYFEELKLNWIKEQYTEKLAQFANLEGVKTNDVHEFSEMVKDFGNEFVKLSSEADAGEEGEYSFTSKDAIENIEKIKQKDITKERRFMIGHRPFDKATKGLRPGEMLMVLGNVNSGKSMVLANLVYNAWKKGANVLLYTHEMQPFEFDERIYCRGSSVEYDNILNGKEFLSAADNMALDECAKFINSKENKIVTKFLQRTDNVATVESHMEDLKLKEGFVPDIIVMDALEHISPLFPSAEAKDHQMVGEVIIEFKDFAQRREVIVVSTHQAKTVTVDKKFDEISIADFGRSKIAAEKPDFAMYIRSKADIETMNVKMIKARRSVAGIEWAMAIDYSKCWIADTVDSTQSELFTEPGGDDSTPIF